MENLTADTTAPVETKTVYDSSPIETYPNLLPMLLKIKETTKKSNIVFKPASQIVDGSVVEFLDGDNPTTILATCRLHFSNEFVIDKRTSVMSILVKFTDLVFDHPVISFQLKDKPNTDIVDKTQDNIAEPTESELNKLD